jgi:vitamin B12 transporter
LTLTTGWQDEHYGFSTTVMANGSYDNSAYDDVKVPGHLRIDMHGHYNINQNVKVFANIQNIGDTNYRTAYGSGSYYINGGRLASAGVTLSLLNKNR